MWFAERKGTYKHLRVASSMIWNIPGLFKATECVWCIDTCALLTGINKKMQKQDRPNTTIPSLEMNEVIVL